MGLFWFYITSWIFFFFLMIQKSQATLAVIEKRHKCYLSQALERLGSSVVKSTDRKQTKLLCSYAFISQ